METDDFFAKMMFNSINTEEYYQNNEDTPSTSDYSGDSFRNEISQPIHQKTSTNLTLTALKTEAAKINQFILATPDMSSTVKFPLDEKIPVFEHGIYAPKKTAENCKVEGKVKFSSADKKRKERNTREQQRSCKISKQIDQLKELLHTSGFKMKKNSKSSVLAGVADYVKELQIQSQEVNRDIRRAIVQSDSCPVSIDKDSFFLDGDSIDFQYKSMFLSSPIPIALAHHDGRFFEYNRAFMEATRMTKILFFLKAFPNEETTMTVPIPNPSNLPLPIATITINTIQDCLRNTTLYKLVDPSNLHAAQQCVARLLINSTQSEHSFLRSIIRSDVGNGNPLGEAGYLGLSLISDNAYSNTASDTTKRARCLSVTFVPADEFI